MPPKEDEELELDENGNVIIRNANGDIISTPSDDFKNNTNKDKEISSLIDDIQKDKE